VSRSGQTIAPAAPAILDAESAETLASCLDAQIDLLCRRESELDSLSECIISGDNDRMEQVLDQMTLSRRSQADADARLDAARRIVAERLGWQVGKTRLANLIGLVEPAHRDALRSRRRQVLELAERISLKHRRTAILLAECTRVNRLLIDCMVGSGRRVTLYGQAGRQQWQDGAGLMDTER